MGAKVQCNSYMPAYYHTKDLNDDVRSTMWSRLYEDSVFNAGQCCNGFMQHNVDGYSEYEKEVLRQTMLKHEAIFHKQVSELHRLYQVQKDLMCDLRRKGISQYSLPMETMHGGQSFSRFVDSQTGWKESMPATSSSGYRESTSDTDNMNLPLPLLKDNDIQAVALPAPVVSLTKESELLNSKKNNGLWKSIDLQLPADVYIDIEDRELSAEEVKVPDPDVVLESEVKLTLVTGCNSSLTYDLTQDKHLPNGFHYHKMSESNGAHQAPHTKEASTSTYGIPGILPSGFQPRQRSWQRSTTTIPMTKDHHNDNMHMLHWDLLESERRERSGDWQFAKPGMGNCRNISSPSPPQYRNMKQFGLQKSLELPPFLLPEHGQKELRFSDMKLRNKALMDTMSARPLTVSSSLPGPSVLMQPSLTNTRSAEASSRTKFMNAGSQLPFGISSEAFAHEPTSQHRDTFSLPPFQSADIYAGKYSSGSIRPYQGFGHEASHQNGFNLSKAEDNGACPSFSFLQLDKPNLNNSACSSYGHPEDSHVGKILKVFDSHDVKLNKTNSFSMALPNGFGDDGRPKIQVDLFSDKGEHLIQSSQWKSQFVMNSRSEGAAHTSSAQSGKALSGLFGHPTTSIDLEEPLKIKSETETLCNNEAYNDGSRSQPNSRPSFASFQADKKELAVFREVGLSLDLNEPFSFDLPSDSSKDCAKFDCSEKHHSKGFIPENIEFQNDEKETEAGHSCASYAYQEFAGTSSSLCKGKTLSLDDRDHQPIHSFKMESLVIGRDAHVSRETSAANVLSLAGAEYRGLCKNHQIDLDLAGNSTVSQTPNVPGELTKKLACNGESGADDYSLETTMAMTTMAAEVLMVISSIGEEKMYGVPQNQPEAALEDSLKWFADVVCYDAAQLEHMNCSSRAKSDNHYVPSDGKDYFEMMTLMLSETKMDEDYCHKSPPEEESKGPETDASPVQNQPCRRSRRGRRQRDFQREILPSLMSLSRHEVTEDMQTIGCLLRVSGCPWPTVLARKNGSRNEWSSPARGRRSRCVAMEVSDTVLPVLQPTSDPRVDENVGLKNLTWGKTTRRWRMQRCPTTAVPTSFARNKS